MIDSFTAALQRCLVQIRGGPTDNHTLGTGVFIGPGLVLTCRHVVAGADTAQIVAADAGKSAEATVVPLALRLSADVALLQTDLDLGAYARLSSVVAVRDKVLARGFPVRDGGPHEEQITGEIEDTQFQHSVQPWKSGARLLKFKQGQVNSGLSGSPLISERTSRVIGIVSASRDVYSDLGGLAVPAAVLLEQDTIVQVQRSIDWSATVWRDHDDAAAPFLEYYLAPNAPFVGRDAELQEFDQWLEQGSPRGLLVASSGQGKSSLLAQWYQRLRASVAYQRDELRVAIVPISIYFDHAREEQVQSSLARAVTELQGHAWSAERSRSTDLRTAIRAALQAPAPVGVRLVLILDGLDETVGWRITPALLPQQLGEGVHVLVAARHLADLDEKGWQERLGWNTPSVAQLHLHPLGLTAHVEAAQQWWSLDTAKADTYSNSLFALTAGDPLVLGLYLSHFGRTAPPVVQLQSHEPGVSGFFKRWWDEQQLQWQHSGAAHLSAIGYAVFNVLAAAFEPMSRKALLGSVRKFGTCDALQLNDALQRLGRFIVGRNDTYILSHPALARWRWRQLEAVGDERRIDTAIVDWSREAARAVTGGGLVDPYVLRCFARHLQRAQVVALDDIALITSAAWREQHQRLERWPVDYLANLDLVDELSRTLDAKDLHARLPCSALGVRVEIVVRRKSVLSLSARVSAGMAEQLVRRGMWTASQALRHVLNVHAEDFPRVEGLGVLASSLGVRELDSVRSSLAVERSYAFSWDNSLGAWHVAAAAAAYADSDSPRLLDWAQGLPGIGAALALFGLASRQPAGQRTMQLGLALAALSRRHEPTEETALAVGIRIANEFAFNELVAAVPRMTIAQLCSLLNFKPHDPKHAAACLRIAWRWLSADEQATQSAALLQSTQALLTLHQRQFMLLRPDWMLVAGAIWDVGSLATARHLCRMLCEARTQPNQRDDRQLYVAAIYFASRLPPAERTLQHEPYEILRMVYGNSRSAPQVRAFFKALAALPEWHESLSQMIVNGQFENEHDAAEALEMMAPAFSDPLLQTQWQAVGRFASRSRDLAIKAITHASASRSDAAARTALSRVDSAFDGIEQHLLDAVLNGLRDSRDDALRSRARLAFQRLPNRHGLRAHLAPTLAVSLAPWTLADCEAWVAQADENRSLILSFLLPHVVAAELADTDTPERLKLRYCSAAQTAVTAALRNIQSSGGTQATLAWATAMDDEVADDAQWLTASIIALAGSDPAAHDTLFAIAIAIDDASLRAQACAALLDHSNGSQRQMLWTHVESQLNQAAARQRGSQLAQVLGRLHGADLERAVALIDLHGRQLSRSAYSSESRWIDEASALLAWASRDAIDAHFLQGGDLVRVDSSHDRDMLRGALAPRLLELGRTELAMHFARMATAQPQWASHSAMLAFLRNADDVAELTRAVFFSPYHELSVLTIARTLATREQPIATEIAYELTLQLLGAAESDHEFRLFLAAFAPVVQRLGGVHALHRAYEATRPR